ncbi:MAG: metalloregulator ArsR/SmtB family transcription factor [Rhizobiaceae bacterium]
MQELEKSIDHASQVMAMLGNPMRLSILCKLHEREFNVTELCEATGLSQSALSQHLAKLRHLQLVKTRRDAQTIYYSLVGNEVSALLGTLHGLYCSADATTQTQHA